MSIIEAPYKVDYNAGSMRGEVSSQWFNRPDDQRYLDLESLHSATINRAENSWAEVIDVRDIEVRANDQNPEHLSLIVPRAKADATVAPTHWSFGQLCTLTKTPAGYLRRLPGMLAGVNLQHSLQSFRQEHVKAYVTERGDDKMELRAATGPEYGRIYDHELVAAVKRIAENGHWKVPGVMNWRDGSYDPNAPVTRESTTLFASDRDVFLFLVDDRNPIKIGTFQRNGVEEDDLIFRGFYAWNSEVGSKTLGVASFYLRGVCQNRCLWGVERFQEIKIRHSKYAPDRFIQEAAPALESFANHNTNAFLNGVASARETIVGATKDDQKKFLTKKAGFNLRTAMRVINTHTEEEGRAPESIWDMVQGITAVARTQGHQDNRLDMERVAGRLLDKVA